MENKICPHCGASLKQYWHSLTPGLVNILVKCIRAVKKKGVNSFHWQDDLGLIKNEGHNFYKLRFHALIAHADVKNKKSGYWLITDRGGQFLRGEIFVPKKVLTYRNRVIGHHQKQIHIKALIGQTGWFENEFDFEIFDGKLKQPIQQQTLL